MKGESRESVVERLREIAAEGLYGIHGFTSFYTERGEEVVTYENMVAANDAAAWIEYAAPVLLAVVKALERLVTTLDASTASGAPNYALEALAALTAEQKPGDCKADRTLPCTCGESDNPGECQRLPL